MGGAQAVRVTNLGKPSPQGDGKIRVDFTSLLNPWPAAGTTYEARVAAVGPNGTGRSTSSNTFAFTSPCSSSISPGSVSVGGGASSGTVTVTRRRWLRVDGDERRCVVDHHRRRRRHRQWRRVVAVAANTTTAQRQGNLSIAGQTFTVTQAAGCTYSITPTATNVAAGASTGNVAVSAGASCQWSASSSAAWISITGGASGSGPGTVSYSVAANTGTTSRTGSATIAGQTFSVTQEGVPCNYTLNPVSATLGPAAGSSTVGVTAQTGCSWTAASGAASITVSSGASGSGNGQVGFNVTANPTTSSRSGAITIGGRPFNVTQTGQSCTTRSRRQYIGPRERRHRQLQCHSARRVCLDGNVLGRVDHDHIGRDRIGQRPRRLQCRGQPRRRRPLGQHQRRRTDVHDQPGRRCLHSDAESAEFISGRRRLDRQQRQRRDSCRLSVDSDEQRTVAQRDKRRVGHRQWFRRL